MNYTFISVEESASCFLFQLKVLLVIDIWQYEKKCGLGWLPGILVDSEIDWT